MKNNNKFLVASVSRATICLLVSAFAFMSFNNNAAAANDSLIVSDKQITNEESVFDTNSTNDIVIEGNSIERFKFLDKGLSKESKLQEAIYEEITDRIDVCKANTDIADTKESIKDLTSAIEESKRIADFKELLKKANESEEAEMAVCNAASENVPNDVDGCRSNVKTYMTYTSVTAKNSNQYKLLYSDECYTDELTGLRMVGERYCIAVGTGYCSEIGTKIDLVLDNGNVVKCILGDVKADVHTDETNRFHAVDGSVAEFIVDSDVYDELCNGSGNVNWIDGLDGTIVKVVVFDEV